MSRGWRCAATSMLVLVLAGCSQPETAGNATWDFVTAVQVRDFEKGFSRVCSRAKQSMSFDQFSTGGALEFAPPIRLETLVGVGADAQADLATEGTDTTTATVLVEGSTGAVTQRWRVELVKEDGAWKICSFTLDSERPRSSTTPGSFGGTTR